MQVFLSWSGDRSQRTAKLISVWLKHVIQAIDPWMSTEIEKGKRWGIELPGKLEKSTAGIICLNRDNIDEKWILFEAGALSKMIADNVCTFLLDINYEDIESPLADFQHTKFDKEDMRRMVHALNLALSKVGERSLEERVLDDSFETYWPRLDKDLKTIIGEKPKKTEPTRTQKEMVAEILEIVRSINRQNWQERFAEQLAGVKIEAQQKVERYGLQPPVFDGQELPPRIRTLDPQLRLGEQNTAKKDD